MSSNLPELGNVPVTGNISLDRYLMAIKVKLLGVSTGQAGVVSLDWNDIQLNPYTTIGEIAAPTNFVVTAGNWKNFLSWTNPDANNLSHIEIWRNTSDDVSTAELEAVVTQPGDKYEHAIERTLLNVNLYYWIRAVSFAGMYSVWTPKPLAEGGSGGYLVNGRDTIGKVIDSVMEALLGGSPANYAPATIYAAGDVVQYTDTDGNTRRYRRLDFSIGDSGVDPTNSTYWELVSILVEGLIDSVPTIGIDGNLVVDGSLFARHIGADEINGTHIHAQSEIVLSEGGKITVGDDNVIIDSAGPGSGSITVSPDGGPDASHHIEIVDGDVKARYYDGAQHHEYKHLSRIEADMAANDTIVAIPGIWLAPPNVMVSPQDIRSFDMSYSNYNQSIRCVAENVELQSGETLKYQFRARAYLDLSDGMSSGSINSSTNSNHTRIWPHTWNTFYSSTYTFTESGVRRISVVTDSRGFAWEESAGGYGWVWPETWTIELYGYINGAWSGVLDSITITQSSQSTGYYRRTLDSGLQTSDITQFRVRFVHVSEVGSAGGSAIYSGLSEYIYQEIILVSYIADLANSNILAEGTLNWVATGY